MPNLNVQSWEFDAPSGVYKSHALSARILEAAIANTQFMAAVDPIEAYGRGKGDTVTIPRFSNMTQNSSYRFGEFENIPEQRVTQSTVAVTVSQLGNSIPYSSFNKDLSPLDIEAALRRALEKNMRLAMDSEAAAAFKEGKIKYIPTGIAAGTFDTDGTASSTAVSNMNYFHLETIRDYAVNTLHMDLDFTLMLATKGCRGIKQDPKFAEWNAPQNREAKVKGEIGVIEGIKIIEVNNTDALSSSKGTNGVLGEGVFFSGKPVSMAVVRQPELMVAKLDPYGLVYGIAWYGNLEFLQNWGDSASAGEAEVIHITSA